MLVLILIALMIIASIWHYRSGNWPPPSVTTSPIKVFAGMICEVLILAGSFIFISDALIERHSELAVTVIVVFSTIALVMAVSRAKRRATQVFVAALCVLPIAFLIYIKHEEGRLPADGIFACWILLVINAGLSALSIVMAEHRKARGIG